MTLLSGGANFIRNTLFVFNFLFVITGIIIISIGTAVSTVYTEFELFLVHDFFSIPTFLIVIGSFIFIIAFFGCYGAYRENYCLILIFSVLLAIIFIFELSAGISGYVLRDKASDLISGKLKTSMNAYVNNNTNEQKLWDEMQTQFSCCGMNNYTDWAPVLEGQKLNVTGLPLTCCNIPHGIIGNYECSTIGAEDNRDLRVKGCLSLFSDYIADHAVSLGAGGVIFAIIQFIAVFFACYIAREVKRKNGVTGCF